MTVNYCTRSTLREAYAAVVGLPAPISADEVPLLRSRFGRVWPSHEFSSRETLLPPEPAQADPDAVLSPTWFAQLTWDDRRWTGRWGHRVLGLHRSVPDGERYETYGETFLPTLRTWLEAAREAYDFAAMAPPAATAVFGYINAFTLDPGAGDLSEWFKFNFNIDAEGADKGLDEITIGARIRRPEMQARARIQLTAHQNDGETRVMVYTVAECDLPAGSTFTRTDPLLSEVGRAKVLARDTFFSFVTDKTLNQMGATDATTRPA